MTIEVLIEMTPFSLHIDAETPEEAEKIAKSMLDDPDNETMYRIQSNLYITANIDESTTPVLDRCKEAGYVQCADGTCTCHGCIYSRTAEYAGGGTKFVCDKLNIQTYKCAWCKYFKLRKEMVSSESICRD